MLPSPGLAVAPGRHGMRPDGQTEWMCNLRLGVGVFGEQAAGDAFGEAQRLVARIRVVDAGPADGGPRGGMAVVLAGAGRPALPPALEQLGHARVVHRRGVAAGVLGVLAAAQAVARAVGRLGQRQVVVGPRPVAAGERGRRRGRALGRGRRCERGLLARRAEERADALPALRRRHGAWDVAARPGASDQLAVGRRYVCMLGRLVRWCCSGSVCGDGVDDAGLCSVQPQAVGRLQCQDGTGEGAWCVGVQHLGPLGQALSPVLLSCPLTAVRWASAAAWGRIPVRHRHARQAFTASP